MKTVISLFIFSCLAVSMSYSMNQTLSLTHSAETAELNQLLALYAEGRAEEVVKPLWDFAKKTKNPDMKAEALVVVADIYYRRGQDTKKNHARAKSCLDYVLRLTKKAPVLAQGYLILGDMYAKGDHGENQDIKKAIDAFAHCVAFDDYDTKLYALIELDKLSPDYSKDLQKTAKGLLAKCIKLCEKGYGAAAIRSLEPLSNLSKYPALQAKALIILGALFSQGDTSVAKNVSEAQHCLELALKLTKNRLLKAECYLLLESLQAQPETISSAAQSSSSSPQASPAQPASALAS